MELSGSIIEIFDTQEVSDRFRKREFVVEYAQNPQYPETVLFQLVQDKCEVLDQYKVNDEVKVSFDVKGRKWVSPKGETKYFNSLNAWRLEKASQDVPQGDPFADMPSAPPANDISDLPEDDLPF